MLDCSMRRPGMLLFRPPETPPDKPARLSYHISRAPQEPREHISTDSQDTLVHLARWNGASFDAMAECWEHGLDLAISSGSRIAGLVRATQAPRAHTIRTRSMLFRQQRDRNWVVATVRAIIDAKILNQFNLLRLYHDRPYDAWADGAAINPNPAWGEAYSDALQNLRRDRRSLDIVDSVASLRGIEGHAAKHYFASWPPLIGNPSFRRQARQAADQTNLLLDLSYARLAHRVTLYLLDQGFDIAAGMLHGDDDGRPSLALDLMEPLRPLVADRFCLRLIRQQHVDWFYHDRGRWHLSTLGWREIKDRWQSWLIGHSRRPGMDQHIAQTVTAFRDWIVHDQPLTFPRLR
ncbi:MAG: CRISPR-associated endonuclease Cas1 [Planctomycetota bacterium]|nr:MAG: CRISPR-associated endonuclease Cas1 [Planctomycetota bacterium]